MSHEKTPVTASHAPRAAPFRPSQVHPSTVLIPSEPSITSRHSRTGRFTMNVHASVPSSESFSHATVPMYLMTSHDFLPNHLIASTTCEPAFLTQSTTWPPTDLAPS